MKQFKTKPSGRPPIEDVRREKWIALRVTPAQHDRFLQLGGSAWVREKLAAEEPVTLATVWRMR